MILSLDTDSFHEDAITWEKEEEGLFFFYDEVDVNDSGVKADFCFANKQTRVDE